MPISKKTAIKKGVPFKMMFRHHMDPDYYDPKANDKIFVPDVTNAEELTEDQKKIVDSFPDRDRGIYTGANEEAKAKVEVDPLDAAIKKMQLRKAHRVQEKALKDGRKILFADEVEQGSDSSSDNSADYFEEDDGEE